MSGLQRLAGWAGRVLGAGKINATRTDRGIGRSTMTAQVQFRATGEVRDDLPILSLYAFTSRPRAGADAVVLYADASHSGGVVVATGDGRFAVVLAEGEAAIHHHDGQKVHLTNAGIVIDGGNKPVVIQNAPMVTAATPNLHCTGKITAVGNIESGATVKATTDVTIGARSFNSHQHTETGTGGGTTSGPI